MKNIAIACITISCALLMNCTQSSELDIRFISQPTGGKNITLLSCTFEGKLLESTTPISVAIEWWSSDSAGNNERLEQQETHIFEDVIAAQVGTELSAPNEDVFEGYYWVRIEWDDEGGAVHYEESAHAFCYEGPNNR